MKGKTNMPEPTTQETLQLKTFIIQQQQAINTAHNQMKTNKVVQYTKKVLFMILEIVMYILFLISLVFVFTFIPLDILAYTQVLGENASTTQTLHIEEISKIIIAARVIIIFGSIGFLVSGLFIRNIRKKHTFLTSAYKTIDELKKSFDAFTAKWSAGS